MLSDKNLYAYCDNNPIMRIDESGEFWNLAVGAIAGGAISAAAQIIGNVMVGNHWTTGVMIATVTGAASGALSASALGKWGQAFANAGISLIGETVNQITSGTFGTKDGLVAIGKSTISGFIAGRLGGDGMRNNNSNYYKAAQSAKKTAERVFGKTYNNTKTVSKILNQAIKMVKKVGYKESTITGVKFVGGCSIAQIITRAEIK